MCVRARVRACASVTYLAVSLLRRSRAYIAVSTTSSATVALPFTSTPSLMVSPGTGARLEGLTCDPTTNQHSAGRPHVVV